MKMRKMLLLLIVSLFSLVPYINKVLAVPLHPGDRPLKVAVVVPASSTDQGWNQMGVVGLIKLKQKWGLTIEIAENQGYGDIKPVLRDLARKGFDLIIAHASGYQTVAPEVAIEKDIRVAVVENPGAVKHGLVSNYEAEAQDGAYLAGVLAAKMTKSHVIGCVVSAEVPDWNRMTVGFMEGLYSVNPKIKFLYNVIGEAAYEDAAGGKRSTEVLIAAGADIIFGMGDGASFGIMKACEENKTRNGEKVWFIDVIGDKRNIDSKEILLASVLWNFGIIYEMMLIDIYNGSFGKDYFQTLENGGIELAIYQSIPAEIKAAMKKTEEDITSGRIKVSNVPATRDLRAIQKKLFK